MLFWSSPRRTVRSAARTGFPIVFAVLFAGVLLPGCASDDLSERLAVHYERAEAVRQPLDLSLDEALRIQQRFVEQIRGDSARVIGYKAGLTSPAVQETFDMDQPVRGTLLDVMMLRSGVALPASFGAVPRAEGDLMVRVGSSAINEAESDSALLAGLDAVIPFLELPDLLFAEDVPVDGPTLVAINVGARRGVVGPATPLPPGQEGYELLRSIHVELHSEADGLITEGASRALLGHPLEVVRWMRNSLRREGEELEPGMLLSLGSITDLVPVRAGQTLRASYTGISSDTVEISVSFE